MNDRLRQQLEEILEQAEVEERSETLMRQALTIDIPVGDGAWLKSVFRLAALFLELAYGSKKEANRALPWLLFSLGMAYERHYLRGGGNEGATPLQREASPLFPLVRGRAVYQPHPGCPPLLQRRGASPLQTQRCITIHLPFYAQILTTERLSL